MVNKFEDELIEQHRVVFNRHQFWEYQRKGKQVHDLGAEFSPPSVSVTDDFFIGIIQVGSSRDPVWFEPISVCGSKIKMKVDTGAEPNQFHSIGNLGKNYGSAPIQ